LPVIREPIMALSFDAVEDRNLANSAKADAPAKLEGDNSLVPGKIGQAVQFNGDDPVKTKQGNFGRHEPFSVSLWLETPDVKERAVVFHRSRAWTDAASRGYELLIEDGKLKWSSDPLLARKRNLDQDNRTGPSAEVDSCCGYL
jgi:hypothetical protein